VRVARGTCPGKKKKKKKKKKRKKKEKKPTGRMPVPREKAF